MKSTFICLHCGKTLPRNPRVKKQKYCPSLECQNARKRLFDRKICLTAKGRLLQKNRNKRWRNNHLAHEYQKQYRLYHPDYEKRNREMQAERNRKRQKDPSSMIVKTDALLLQPLYDGIYAGFKVKNGKIVKTDTLLLQMQVQPGLETVFPSNPG